MVLGVRHHGIKIDLESVRQFDLLQVGTDRIRILAVLRDRRKRHVGGGIAHALERRQVGVLCTGRSGAQCGDRQSERSQIDLFHDFPFCIF